MATRGTAGFAQLVQAHRRIGLDAVRAAADLQTRFDTKYVLSQAAFADFLGHHLDRFHVLEVDGRVLFDYENHYFDTSDLVTYRAHFQRRRRRFKIRTRSYDSGQPMLEVKVKDGRARTVKHRVAHRAGAPARLDAEGRRFVAGVLEGAYGMAAPEGLVPAISTRYRRVTLIDLEAGERITLDQRLRVGKEGCVVHFDPAMLIMEAKSARPVGQASRLLARHGIRPVRVSKQAVGVATLCPDQPNHPWRPALRCMQPCRVELEEAGATAHSAAAILEPLLGRPMRGGHAARFVDVGLGSD